jgi:hypothetical protein
MTGQADMELYRPNEQKYVRLEDFEDEQRQNAQARSLMTDDIADVRLNETKLSMIMSRLLQFLSRQIHPSENPEVYCGCPRCDVLLKVRDIINSDPPIKAGTQPVKGLDAREVVGTIPHGRPLGTDVYSYREWEDSPSVGELVSPIAYTPAPGNGNLRTQEGIVYPVTEPGFAQGVRAEMNEALIQTGKSTGAIERG